MRKLLAACVIMGAMSITGSATAQNGAWTYAYVDGVATATQRDDDGDVVVTLMCRPPTGDIVITDHTFGRAARRVESAGVRIGAMLVQVPATVEGRGSRARVVVNLPQRPPILAAVQPTDRLSVTVNGTTHTYEDGGPAKMREVAYACWGS